jgi:ParB/RepB/Spo0J family partition protein
MTLPIALEPTSTEVRIPIAQIQPNPQQPRQAFDAGALQELADSIQVHGVLQPLVVWREPGLPEAFVLIAGERRLRAATLAGLTEVPCVLKSKPGQQDSLELALIENIQRADLSPADEARAYQRLHDEFGLTDEQIGQRVGKARSTISNLRRLVDLPASALARIGSGEGQIPYRYMRQLVPIARAIPEKDLAETLDHLADPSGVWESPEDLIADLYENAANPLLDKVSGGWGLTWPAKPMSTHDGEGDLEIPACKPKGGEACPFYVDASQNHYCTNARCYELKRGLFRQHELVRVSKKTGVAVAAEGENVKLAPLDYETERKVNTWFANSQLPDHLRLLVDDGQAQHHAYTHHQVLGSNALLLGTLSPALFKSNSETLAEMIDTPEFKSMTSQQDQSAEEAAKRERRDEKAAKRKAVADIDWLGLNTAKAVASQIKADGVTLTWLYHYVGERESGYGWAVMRNRKEAIEKEVEAAKTPAATALLMKESIVLSMIAGQVCQSYDEDWHEDFAEARYHAEEIVSKPRKGYKYREEASMGLTLPAGWDKPPVHHTESNCWVCGKFTANEKITKRDIDEDGWETAGDGTVTCSDKCRKQVKPKRVGLSEEAKTSARQVRTAPNVKLPAKKSKKK